MFQHDDSPGPIPGDEILAEAAKVAASSPTDATNATAATRLMAATTPGIEQLAHMRAVQSVYDAMVESPYPVDDPYTALGWLCGALERAQQEATAGAPIDPFRVARHAASLAEKTERARRAEAARAEAVAPRWAAVEKFYGEIPPDCSLEAAETAMQEQLEVEAAQKAASEAWHERLAIALGAGLATGAIVGSKYSRMVAGKRQRPAFNFGAALLAGAGGALFSWAVAPSVRRYSSGLRQGAQMVRSLSPVRI